MVKGSICFFSLQTERLIRFYRQLQPCQTS